MPWLLISTLLGVLWRNLHSPRRSVTFGLLALLLPAAVWVGWGVTLRSKYGVFTTGYQLRRNLMVNWHRRFTHHPRGDDQAFTGYQGADTLRQAAPTGTLVSIGAGPYPEHGVGFEAGPYIAYLSGWRLIGLNSALPPLSSAEDLRNQVLAVHADAVAVWGTPADSTYRDMTAHLRIAPGLTSSRPISDPYKGEVGTIFIFTAGRFQTRWPEGNPTSYR